MSDAKIIGFSGNITRPSKTFALVDHVVQDVARATGLAGRTYDIEDLGLSLLQARRASNFDAQAQDILKRIVASDILVVGSPTYKGSYTGLFKHFFDLVDPAALRGKPVVLTATGGGDRHALIVEHSLRPLFGFFETLTPADRNLCRRPGLRRRHSRFAVDARSADASRERSAYGAVQRRSVLHCR